MSQYRILFLQSFRVLAQFLPQKLRMDFSPYLNAQKLVQVVVLKVFSVGSVFKIWPKIIHAYTYKTRVEFFTHHTTHKIILPCRNKHTTSLPCDFTKYSFKPSRLACACVSLTRRGNNQKPIKQVGSLAYSSQFARLDSFFREMWLTRYSTRTRYGKFVKFLELETHSSTRVLLEWYSIS